MESSSVVMKKPSPAELAMNSIRARARANRSHVKLQRMNPPDQTAMRSSMQKIRTLKSISADDLPNDPTQPTFIGRLWGKFQELLGNR